jgi:hypothetical protein
MEKSIIGKIVMVKKPGDYFGKRGDVVCFIDPQTGDENIDVTVLFFPGEYPQRFKKTDLEFIERS